MFVCWHTHMSVIMPTYVWVWLLVQNMTISDKAGRGVSQSLISFEKGRSIKIIEAENKAKNKYNISGHVKGCSKQWEGALSK